MPIIPQRYKTNFLIFMLLANYSILHLAVAGNYEHATFQQFVEFNTPLPYAQRLLVPAIAAAINKLSILNVKHLFLILEFIFVGLLYISLKKLFTLYFFEKKAIVLSLLFFILSSFIYLINYRYLVGKEASFNYPYDTPALFFAVLGMFLILQKQWKWTYVCIFFATLNRESSLLILLLIPVLQWQDGRRWHRPFIISTLIYIAVRLAIDFFLIGTPGSYAEWYYGSFQIMHYQVNVYWLFSKEAIYFFVAEFGFLPLVWLCLYNYIPPQFRPVRYIVFIYVIGLFYVGNFMESRIFGECAILMYLPACLAIDKWLKDEPFVTTNNSLWHRFERHAIIVAIVLFGLTYQQIYDILRLIL